MHFGRVDRDDDEGKQESCMSTFATRVRATALVLASAATAGCSLLPPVAEPMHARTDGVHPATAAWALAMLCRAEHPSVDPQGGGPVPVLLDGDGIFRIHVARPGANAPYRCAMDGRLTAPFPRMRANGTLHLEPPRFVASGRRTRAPGSGDQLTIAVHPGQTEPSCPEITISASGEALSPTLRAQLTAAIGALRAACEAAALLEVGEHAAAERTIEGFLDHLDREGVTGLGVLLAPVHAQLGAALVASGEPGRARQALSLAQRASPDCHALGQEIARLDARLARTEAASSLLGQIAADPRGGAATRIAAATPADRALPASVGAANQAHIAHREARRRLHAGDVEGAAAWASRALEHAADPTLGLDLELARARGDHRTAFVLGVEQLARFGFDPQLVLTMADDAEAFGDPSAGVRLLARHWDELERTAPTPLRATVDRLASIAGTDRTARIALTEGCRALSSRVLDPTARVDLPRTRLASLRSRALPHAPRPQLLDAGFGLGPGLAPAR